jgi:outer membrane lipoprotein SlyB
MNNARRLRAVRAAAALLASSVVVLAAAQTPPSAADCDAFPCGRVESIVQSTVKQSWTPLGTTGAVGGDNRGAAVTAFEIGPGMSNKGMVLLGAAGGAVYRKTPNAYEKPQWQVTVKLDSGQTRVLTLAFEPYVREGDRVRVAGNHVELVN